MKKGLIHVYYGDGKGKTTAAIGLGVRALGAGLKVFLAQFLKTNASNELKALKQMENFEVAPSPNKLPFYFKMTQAQKRDYIEYALKTFQQTLLNAAQNDVDVLILDEILDAVALNIIPFSEVITFLSFKPLKLEVILTGHTAHESIVELADYVTVFNASKHPFNKGVKARKGIEF